jgi:DNA-binding transcriptional ArsR family regulator
MIDSPEPTPVVLPPEPNGVQTMAKFFRTLGDPVRLRLLEFLLHEERTVWSTAATCGYVARVGWRTTRSRSSGSPSWCCWPVPSPRTTPRLSPPVWRSSPTAVSQYDGDE